MGLGKTLSAIVLIASDGTGAGVIDKPEPLSPDFENIHLVVCPLSVIGKYVRPPPRSR